MNNFLTIIVLLSTFLASNVKAQIDCGNPDSPPTESFYTGPICDATATYPSSNLDFKPISTFVIRTIKLKFIIVQNPSKPYNGNFENNSETTKYFNDVINNVNSRYSTVSNDPSCPLPNPTDLRIRFEHTLLFVSDSTGSYWDNPSSEGYSHECPGYSNWDLDPLMSEPEAYLNVFWTEDGAFFDYVVSGIGSHSYNSIACSEFYSTPISLDHY